MIYTFETSELLPGDLIQVRSMSRFGRAIRAIIGSYTNHTAMIVWDGRQFYIGEAVPPRCKLTTLEEYQRQMANGECVVRVLRVPNATPEQREEVSQLFIDTQLGLKYPLFSVFRLWRLRFVNDLKFKMNQPWCTVTCWRPWHAVIPKVLMRPPDKETPEGKEKNNPTPRTVENRLMAGVLVDVTDKCLIETP